MKLKLSTQEVNGLLDSVFKELQQVFGTEVLIKASDLRSVPLLMLLANMHPDFIKVTENAAEAEAVLMVTVPENLDKDTLDVYHVFLATEDVSLPWEEDKLGTYIEAVSPTVYNLLQHIADDADREGLRETPKRVAKAWAKWTEGYSMDAATILKVFEDGAENCDEMVIVKDIPIYSKCEHHLADIFGTATIAYIPNGKIVGLSKLSRLADMFARRLQVQERLTNQIADAIEEHLEPLGVGVVIRARHMCMESRGICQQGHHTITAALRGVLKTNPEARAEFMALANSSKKV